MTKEKWEEIIDNVKKGLEVFGEGIEEEGSKKIEWIEFVGPQGKSRLEWIDKPRITGVKTLYSRRAGTSAGKVEHEESKTERVNFIRAYKWSDETRDWEEIDAGSFGG